MCYAGCKYELPMGFDNQGDCSLFGFGKDIPGDALCVESENFTVKCDEENNPQSVIDNNELVVDITIKPNLPTCEEFDEYIKMMGEIDSWSSSASAMFPDAKPVFETRKEQDDFIEKFYKDVTNKIKESDEQKRK